MFGWLRRGEKQTAPPPMKLELTPAARSQLSAVLGRQSAPAALRIFVRNPGDSPPQFDMSLEPADAVRHGDTVVDLDGLRVLVDAESRQAVDGATVDFRDDPLQPGFLIEPPRIEVPGRFDAASRCSARKLAARSFPRRPPAYELPPSDAVVRSLAALPFRPCQAR